MSNKIQVITTRVTLIAVLSFYSSFIYAQTDTNDVTLTVTGLGSSINEARQVALKSAVERAFGVFVSSSTEMLNDAILLDKMATISSGTIKAYETLSELMVEPGKWFTSLKVVVSKKELIRFLKVNHSTTVEFNSDYFIQNIGLLELNEKNEIDIIKDLYYIADKLKSNLYRYNLKVGSPTIRNNALEQWSIPMEASVYTSTNMNTFVNLYNATLRSISMTDLDVINYKSINKSVYSFNNYFFRNQSSVNWLNSIGLLITGVDDHFVVKMHKSGEYQNLILKIGFNETFRRSDWWVTYKINSFNNLMDSGILSTIYKYDYNLSRDELKNIKKVTIESVAFSEDCEKKAKKLSELKTVRVNDTLFIAINRTKSDDILILSLINDEHVQFVVDLNSKVNSIPSDIALSWYNSKVINTSSFISGERLKLGDGKLPSNKFILSNLMITDFKVENVNFEISEKIKFGVLGKDFFNRFKKVYYKGDKLLLITR